MKRILSAILIILFSSTLTAQSAEMLREARNLMYTDPQSSEQKAAEVFKTSNRYENRISALTLMINAQMILGKSRAVVDNCQTGLELARNHKDSNNEIRILSMLGNQYQSMLMNDEAKNYLDAAENRLQNHPLPDSLLFFKGNLYNIKGIVFRSELNCNFALKYFDKALEVYQHLPQDATTLANQMLVEIQKGYCLLAEGQPQRALVSFDFVLGHPNRGIGNNVLFARIGKAQAYAQMGKTPESTALLENIPAQELNNADNEIRSLYYFTLMNNELSQHKGERYIQDFKNYLQNADALSVSQDRVIDQMISDSNLQYSKIRHQTTFRYMLFLMAICIIFVPAIIFTGRKFPGKATAPKNAN